MKRFFTLAVALAALALPVLSQSDRAPSYRWPTTTSTC